MRKSKNLLTNRRCRRHTLYEEGNVLEGVHYLFFFFLKKKVLRPSCAPSIQALDIINYIGAVITDRLNICVCYWAIKNFSILKKINFGIVKQEQFMGSK